MIKQSLILILATVLSIIKASDFDVIQDVTYSMSQFMGEQLNFEIWTGYIPVGTEAEEEDGATSLFFSLATKVGETIEKMSPDTPVVFWFNGGPGCSSQYGNWLEIGPIQLDGELHPSLREYSWNKQALLVFTDQPINAGLSYSSNPDVVTLNTRQATLYFKTFITKFYEHFTNLNANPTYFFGESYAGHYIPSFAQMMLEDKPVSDLNFQGIGIGDGWTAPEQQMGSMSDFFFNIGVASQGQREEIAVLQDEGIKQIQEENYAQATHIFDAITDDTAQYGEIDQYNFFYYNLDGQFDPYTVPYFEDLLNNSVFRDAYGVPKLSKLPKFTNCNETIYDKFNDDFTQSYRQNVEYLLNQDIKVLLFNGQLDIIVNTAGAQDWINTLEWKDLSKWQYADRNVFKHPDNKNWALGNYQTYSNFCFVNVYLAGHMVPSDQPEAAFLMLQNYLDWTW